MDLVNYRYPKAIWGTFLRVDKTLLVLLVVVSLFSLALIYSTGGQSLDGVWKHGARILSGFAAMFVLGAIPLPLYIRAAPYIYFILIISLVLVIILGDSAKGAQRWLDLGFVKFQPSELFKVAMPLYLSTILCRDEPHPCNIQKTMLASMYVSLTVVLVGIQPDLGTAVLIGICGMVVIFLAGPSKKQILVFVVIFLTLIPLVWHFAMLDYQKLRVTAFLNPNNTSQGSGYHIIQSKIAIGSGGLWGKGWLKGSQSQLGFLPEKSTDFVFSVLAEEFGFAGVVVLFTLLFMLTMRGLYVAMHASNIFGRLLGAGLSFSFFINILTNLGMVSGLLPVVGVPLPIMSYGGTSVISVFAIFGILVSIQHWCPMMRDNP